MSVTRLPSKLKPNCISRKLTRIPGSKAIFQSVGLILRPWLLSDFTNSNYQWSNCLSEPVNKPASSSINLFTE